MIGRGLLAIVAVFALASCTVATNAGKPTATAAEGCVQSASRDLALLDAKPDYVVEAHSFEGPTPEAGDFAVMAQSNPCASATVVLTFRRKNDGAFVHGYVASMNQMELIEGHAGPAFDGARLKTFLEGWTEAFVSTTDTASEMSETVTTHLDAAGYAAMKAAKKRMVCYATSVHDTACYAVNPDDAYRFESFYAQDHS